MRRSKGKGVDGARGREWKEQGEGSGRSKGKGVEGAVKIVCM